MNPQHIVTVTDAATGYSFTLRRVDSGASTCEYEIDMFSPADGEKVDGTGFVPVRSDGTGPLALGE